MTEGELHERLIEVLQKLQDLRPMIDEIEARTAVWYKRAMAAEKRVQELEAQIASEHTVPLS
jgi:hypothetical protein